MQGKGNTMGQGEQWDSKHSRKNQPRNEVHLFLTCTSMLNTFTSKRLTSFLCQFYRERLLSHCSPCSILPLSPLLKNILDQKKKSSPDRALREFKMGIEPCYCRKLLFWFSHKTYVIILCKQTLDSHATYILYDGLHSCTTKATSYFYFNY